MDKLYSLAVDDSCLARHSDSILVAANNAASFVVKVWRKRNQHVDEMTGKKKFNQPGGTQ